ncbi:MAG: GlcG/HbpS family heme-binding protein [Rhodoferax sp.]
MPSFYPTSVCCGLAAALALLASAASVQAQSLKPGLSLSTAKKIAQGCEDRARKEGWNMNIAIVDEGGNLKHFTSMDNAFLATAKIAQLKAHTSAGLPFSTRQVREAAKGAQGLEHTPDLLMVAGGLPIQMADGKLLGAIGVSGASEDQDETCAKAGLEAARELLK